MKKNLMNKSTLKLLSLVIAFFIWLLVMNIEDPVREVDFYNIPVTFANTSYIESMNKVPMLTAGKETVDVSITGKSTIVGKLKAGDIIATADLTQIIDMNSEPIMVPVTVRCEGVPEKAVTTRTNNIPVILEERESLDSIVAVNIGDTKPDKDYEVGRLLADPEKITITGPASVVRIIDKVVAQVDVNGMKEDTQLDANLVIYDKNQVKLSDKQMSYLRFNVPISQALVNVDLWKIKKDVKIEVLHVGTPKVGYEVSEIMTVPETISVAGTDEALKKLEENGNKIVIPEDQVSVNGRSKDFEAKIDIQKFLPENIKLATDVNESILANVKILPFGSREYTVPVTEIAVINRPENMDVIFEREKISVRIKGRETDLDRLDPKDIEGKLDLKEYKAGEYEIPVEVDLPNGCQLVEEISVKVKLVKAAEKMIGE